MTDMSHSLGELLTTRGTRVQVRVGESLFREGDASTSVYICLSGRVKVFVTTPSGRDLLLGVKTPGLVFGELSAIDQRPRSASASATENSIVATMSSDELLDSLRAAPMIAVDLLRSLAEQLRRSNARIGARFGENTTVRVGHLLLELGDKFRRHGAGLSATSAIAIPISQDELASWIGASREATARSLATFRQSGAISTARQCITLHDVEGILAVTARAT